MKKRQEDKDSQGPGNMLPRIVRKINNLGNNGLRIHIIIGLYNISK